MRRVLLLFVIAAKKVRCLMMGDHPMVLGITGGIAMGKSSCTEQLRRVFGIQVHDADAAVHKLYGPGGKAVAPVVEAFGAQVLNDDKSIDRAKLSKALKGSFKKLEAIVHPLVTQDRLDFIIENAGRWLCAVDIPLLFETMPDPEDHGIHKVLVVSCRSMEEQKRRALKRPNMSEGKLDAILARQLSDEDRIAKADFLVDTSHLDKAAARAQIAAIVQGLYVERYPPLSPRLSESKNKITCVSLDLDDTLWPTRPAIDAVQATSKDLLPKLMPKTAKALNGANPYADVIGPSASLEGNDQRLAHDFTALRRFALRKRAAEHGDPLERADELLDAMMDVRSKVAAENLLPGALDLVSQIRSLGPITVGALTNGNARPYGRLADALDFWLGAPDIGAVKPSLAAFLAAASQVPPDSSSSPSSLLAGLVHVGDSIDDDAIGALNAGARAILVPRPLNPMPFDTSKLSTFDSANWAIADSLNDVPTILERWL